MTIVHAKLVGREAVVPQTELNRLMELARRSDEIQLQVQDDDVPTSGIMQLAENGGAFDFLAEDEELYTVSDLKVRYR